MSRSTGLLLLAVFLVLCCAAALTDNEFLPAVVMGYAAWRLYADSRRRW